MLATRSGDHKVSLWEVAIGELLRSFEGHVHSVKAIAFSPDGKKFVTGSKAYPSEPNEKEAPL
ncbi:MAG: WD40 repeat domain-containing protein [Candidatus Hodarchaeota archaeon]